MASCVVLFCVLLQCLSCTLAIDICAWQNGRCIPKSPCQRRTLTNEIPAIIVNDTLFFTGGSYAFENGDRNIHSKIMTIHCRETESGV